MSKPRRKTYFLAAQERLRTVDSVLLLILCVFYHTGIIYCQFGVCSVCKVHFTLARAASHLTARQQVQSHCGLNRPYQLRVLDCRLMMECGGCGMWLAMPRGPWSLACLLGGLERGTVPLLLFQWDRGGALLNISALVFLFRNGFPFTFTDVHSVCGFIITPRSARYEVHEAVKEDPCLCAI